MNKNIKEGDLVLVSAEATGLSKPMEAIIDKIETFMKQTLVTVTYTQPNILSGFGGCFVDAHTKLLYQKKNFKVNCIFDYFNRSLQCILYKTNRK